MNEELSMTSLTALLRHFDWAPASKNPGLYEIWQPPKDEFAEVLIPLDPLRGDYGQLLASAQHLILQRYGQAAANLVADMQMRTRALLAATRWKKETVLDAGLISWEQGEGLYACARAQLGASAKAAKEKRRYHGSASSYLAKNFLDNTLMGQTSIGSFVITAYTPSGQHFYTSQRAEEHAHERPQDLWDSERVSGGEILDTFQQALEAVRTNLDEYKRIPRVEPFLEAVSAGVSFEFTRALAKLVEGGDAAVEIERDAMGGQSATSRVEIAFDAVEAPVLTKVMNAFAVDPEPEDVTLVGEVTLLSRELGRGDRVIRLDVSGRGQTHRKARVRLDAEQYEVALEAHRQELPLRVTGSLEREGKIYWMYLAEGVAPVGDDTVDSHHPSEASGHGDGPTLFDDVEHE